MKNSKREIKALNNYLFNKNIKNISTLDGEYYKLNEIEDLLNLTRSQTMKIIYHYNIFIFHNEKYIPISEVLRLIIHVDSKDFNHYKDEVADRETNYYYYGFNVDSEIRRIEGDLELDKYMNEFDEYNNDENIKLFSSHIDSNHDGYWITDEELDEIYKLINYED